MGRKKLTNTPTMSQRVNDWRKKTSVAYTIKLNKETQGDVIDKFAQVENKTSYIVELVRKDIELSGGKTTITITLADLSKEMSDHEKARLEFSTGAGTPTIWHARKQDIESDTRIVKEWHRDSDNIICAKVKVR